MKIKCSWCISFCLMLFISFSPCIAKADVVNSFSNANPFYTNSFSTNTDKNKLVVCWRTTDGYETFNTYSSNNPIVAGMAWNSSLSTYNISFNAPVKFTRFSYRPDNTVEENTVVSTSYSSGTAPGSTASYRKYETYFRSGDVTVNFTTSTQMTSSALSSVLPQTSKPDILNYNWTGDGIKIYNLDKGMNVSGYVDEDNLKYFDIETYGKFTYKGSNTFFTSYAYKKMQTSIQLSSVVTYGSLTRHAGEGLGIKSFQWISDTSHLNTGDEIRFRIVYKIPMLDKGAYDIKIGTTYNNGLSDLYMYDSVTGVNFLNENWEYGSPLDTSGETGNVGSQPGNQPPSSGSNGYGTNIQENFSSLITLFSSFSGFIGSLFGFLPSEIKILFTVVCSIIVALMVKRAVL
ncbi:hypothetical protein GKZ28_09105 [Clostridium chromiireducens]|uniref:Uncharacterized protein n=1 Tax=Clostridium chromiireducens TaxID=225345 RepID=A0A964RLN7_9CLOT|nr:hypothetical protein [Clostridium chromiireducens]MVX63851.1 hypothetical protein [Clostridium chromiireducens]